MKTILIPTDFSDNATNAIDYAANFFQNLPCKFILMNSFHIPVTAMEVIPDDYMNSFKEASQKGLDLAMAGMLSLELHPESTVETRSVFGTLSYAITAISEINHVDYIVMGTKGASGLSEILMGSNTATTISQVDCPVICVPEKGYFRALPKLLFAADLDVIEDETVLDPIIEFAELHQMELLILHVKVDDKVPAGFSNATNGFELHSYFGGIKHEFHETFNKDIESGIQEFAKENHVEMIVTLKRKHPIWQRLFNRSISKKMAFHTETPLLVLKA